jgi:hypothetical protein
VHELSPRNLRAGSACQQIAGDRPLSHSINNSAKGLLEAALGVTPAASTPIAGPRPRRSTSASQQEKSRLQPARTRRWREAIRSRKNVRQQKQSSDSRYHRVFGRWNVRIVAGLQENAGTCTAVAPAPALELSRHVSSLTRFVGVGTGHGLPSPRASPGTWAERETVVAPACNNLVVPSLQLPTGKHYDYPVPLGSKTALGIFRQEEISAKRIHSTLAMDSSGGVVGCVLAPQTKRSGEHYACPAKTKH